MRKMKKKKKKKMMMMMSEMQRALTEWSSNYGDAFRSVVGKEVLEVCLRSMDEWKEGQPLPHSLMYELGSQVRNEVADELINLYLEVRTDVDPGASRRGGCGGSGAVGVDGE